MTTAPKPTSRQATNRRLVQKVAALRAYLDELDEQTRLPGEPPLREAVAEQARQRLAEMDVPCGRCGKGNSGDHDWDCLDGRRP